MVKVDNNKYENIEQVGFKISHLSFFKGLTPNNVVAENVYRWLCYCMQTEDNQSLAGLKGILDVVVKTLKSDQNYLSSSQQEDVKPLKQKDICIEQLSIKNFRKFQGDNFTFHMKACCMSRGTEDMDGKIGMGQNGNSIGRSLFLIGNNGVGKSSIYDALEWIMTGGISEGIIRKRDFRQLPYAGAPEPMVELKLTDGQTFKNYNDFEKEFRGNRMLALFCSEMDIFRIGQDLSKHDYTMFFARLMGYGDVVDLYDFLFKYSNDLAEKSKGYSKEKLEGIKLELKESEHEQERFLEKLLDTLWISMDNFKRKKEFVIIRKITSRIQNMIDTIKKKDKECYHIFMTEMDYLDKEISDYKELNNTFIKNNDEEVDNGSDENNKTETNKEYPIYENIIKCYDKLKATIVPQNIIAGRRISVEEDENQIDWHNILSVLEELNTIVNNKLLIGAEEATKNYLEQRTKVDSYRRNIGELEYARIIQENNEDITNYLKAINKKIHKLVKENCTPYIELILHIMEDFKQEGEDFDLFIGFDKDELKIRLKNKKGDNISAARFYNSFRYKLFCLLLKLVGGLAYMKLDNVRIPIILDDVFYGSDFYSRTKVKKFFVMLLNGIKKQLKNKDKEGNVQIICLTHDEVVLNAVVDAVAETQYKLVSFGRIIDACRIVSEAHNQKKGIRKNDEGNIYVKFFQA